MKKEILIVVVLAVIIFALISVLALVPTKKPITVPTVQEGIQIFSPVASTEISSPLKITGVVTGNGWAGFEGQVGIVKLLDSGGNVLAQTYLAATTEWTSLPTNFEATLNFASDEDQPGSLVFHNENPSGDPARDKTFILPIKIYPVK